MINNIYDAVEYAVAKHGLNKDIKKYEYIDLFRSSRWPEGTVVGSPEHIKVLQALADKHGAKFTPFSGFVLENRCRFEWGVA